MVAVLRDVPAVVESALDEEIRNLAADFKRADDEAKRLEQSSLAARSAANAARADANGKLSELGAALAKHREQWARRKRDDSWEDYCKALGVDRPQLAWDWMRGGAVANDHAEPNLPTLTPRPGRPVRLEDDLLTLRVGRSAYDEAIARIAEATQVPSKEKVDAAIEQALMARKSLDEFLRAHHVHVDGSNGEPPSSGRDFDANRKRLQVLYKQRVDAKLCVKCGAPALPGQVRCHVHREVLAEQKQREKERP